MRPERAAFRELDKLVRSLGEQLAVYRKRALAGEARLREVEAKLGGDVKLLQSLHAELAKAKTERDEAISEVSGARREMASLKKQFDQAVLEWSEAALRTTPQGVDKELREENERLRTLLEDARQRTGALLERFRFLRQQVGQGGGD